MLLTWMMTPTIHWQDMTMMAPGHSSVGTLTPYLIKSVIQIFSIFYFITGCPGIISLSFSSFLSKGGMSIRVVFDQKPFRPKTFPCLSKIFRKWTLNLLPHLLKWKSVIFEELFKLLASYRNCSRQIPMYYQIWEFLLIIVNVCYIKKSNISFFILLENKPFSHKFHKAKSFLVKKFPYEHPFQTQKCKNYLWYE